ncbi:site-specific integrase [Eubacteriales bacterium DFI.9.88]|nr:site-specific integrase [Eubacteriales bacterium DFI.9.88]
MTGSITQRGKHTYRLQVCMGADLNGNTIRFTKTVHAANKKEVEKELAKFYLECEEKRAIRNPNCTVAAFINIWWNEYVKVYTKRSTWRGYDTAINCHIRPKLGGIQLRKLTAMRIQKWVNELVADELSPKTVRNYYSVLRNLLGHAVKWDYLEKNPCDKVTLPRRKKVEARYYTLEEVKRLIAGLNVLSDEYLEYKVAIYLGLFAGLRKGEILGINEEDVFIDKLEIQILRSRMIAPEVGPYEDTPKTESSCRIISIPKELMDMIELLLHKQSERKAFWGNKWRASKALLKGIQGGPLYPQNLQRWFTKFLEENQLRHIGLHGLRHTHTAILASMTDDLSQISRRLGHSELSTTLNIYTHLFEDHDKKLAESISEKFSQELNKGGKEDD